MGVFLIPIVCVALLGTIGWALFKLMRMPDSSRIDEMNASIDALRERVAMLERQPGTQRAGAVHPTGAAQPTGGMQPTHASMTEQPHLAPMLPADAPTSPPSRMPAPAGVARPAPARRDVSLETFLGGRVMLVAGVIVGLFGIAFFLKYAIEHGWIGPALRVAMGALAGVALLVGGDRLRRRGYDPFGQALMGCGLGAVYLSNYFASTRYGLVGQSGAFLAAAAITAAGAALAVIRSAPALAFLGFLGGYLAPALLATSSGELGGLTGWLLVIDAGVLVVLMLRAWKGLDLLALLATLLYFIGWFDASGGSGDALGDSGYLAALVAASLLLSLLPPIVRREAPGLPSLAGAAGTGLFGMLAGHALLFPTWRTGLGAAALVLGAVYVVASRLLAARVPAARDASESLLGLAVAALATAIGIALTGNAVSLALSATGVAVVFAGTRTRQRVLLAGGIGLITLAFGDLMLRRLGMFSSVETPFLNERFVVFACPCVALLVCGRLLSRTRDLVPEGSVLVSAAGLWALPLVVCADMMCGVRLDEVAGFEHRLAATTVVLALYGAVVARLIGAGRDASWRVAAAGPIAMAMLFGVWLVLAGHRMPFVPGWNLSFGAGLVLVVASLAAAASVAPAAREALHVLPLLYLFALITAEIHAWGVQRPLSDFTRQEAQFTAVVWISIAWALYASALVAAGFWKRRAGLRWLGLAVFALTTGKVFFFDLARLQPVYRIGSFLALGALLVAASFLYQRARRSDELSA